MEKFEKREKKIEEDRRKKKEQESAEAISGLKNSEQIVCLIFCVEIVSFWSTTIILPFEKKNSVVLKIQKQTISRKIWNNFVREETGTLCWDQKVHQFRPPLDYSP